MASGPWSTAIVLLSPPADSAQDGFGNYLTDDHGGGHAVLARGQSGMIEASPTHTPSTPYTRPVWSTTAWGSVDGPIRQVEVG